MRNILLFGLLLFAAGDLLFVAGAHAERRPVVELATDKGTIRLELYNETPRHRDNFLRLVRSGYYDGVLFHRVIRDFMIQWGDSTTRHALPGEEIGEYDPHYTVPAEINYPRLYHKRGALAAAREGDDVNPEWASSSAQVYIVFGKTFTDHGLDVEQKRIDEATGGKAQMTDDIRTVYRTLGGTPHLDGSYTVFGEVSLGMDVVARIQAAKTDKLDRPEEDIHIIKATVVE